MLDSPGSRHRRYRLAAVLPAATGLTANERNLLDDWLNRLVRVPPATP